jgi:hypothetical protein
MSRHKKKDKRLPGDKRERLELIALRMGVWDGLAGILGFLLAVIELR